MDIRGLENKLEKQPVFSTAQLAVYYPDQKISSLRQNLYNWQQKGYVIQLKKGLYSLASARIDPARIAQLIYEPS